MRKGKERMRDVFDLSDACDRGGRCILGGLKEPNHHFTTVLQALIERFPIRSYDKTR
jgi:hypothetical protein